VSGGLMSYGENLSDFFHRAAFFVDKYSKELTPATYRSNNRRDSIWRSIVRQPMLLA
jgi:hypothetical protein